MATFYLVRHGSNDVLGKALAARLPNVHLNAQGREEARRVARALSGKGIQRIFSSPLERATETAEALAEKLGLPVEVNEKIHEIDFGDWSGRSMAELESLPGWKLFNSYRSGTRIPGGETMLEIQSRVVAFLERLRTQEPDGRFAIFSHGDPIKTAIAYYLGVPLDLFTRIEISPGSYSVLRLEQWGPQILGVNVCPE
jgi:probable phosphomutase (TIGR03848 family)